MSSAEYVSTPQEPPIGRPFLASIRSIWCRHRKTVTVPKSPGMPAHTVCVSCGWREPVLPATPRGTRTWDSSRDEARYLEQKRQREAIEARQQLVTAARAVPLARTPRREHIVPIRRASGE
jgi:hypothetical protein